MSLGCFVFLALIAFLFSTESLVAAKNVDDKSKSNISSLAGIRFPDPMSSFNEGSSSTNDDCSFSSTQKPNPSLKQTLKLHLKTRSPPENQRDHKNSVFEFKFRDSARIQTLHRRISEKKNQSRDSRLKSSQSNEESKRKRMKNKVITSKTPVTSPEAYPGEFSGQLMATLESGVSLGSGEYFMDVFIGTPPKHFSLILDTGSDLNWIQCVPCHDCFEQNGEFYNPTQSESYKDITCNDPKCDLVSSPDPPQPCKSSNQTCPYYYWYGDSSNTTGDFAHETFTVNLTSIENKPVFKRVENVMFGCGHWNRGLFHGAAGLLGLGRGPLSFSSQLQSLYGHSFSYCLVDRNSNSNVSSKLIFGEDKDLLAHPNLNFTSFVTTAVDATFYYVNIKSVIVGGEVLNIPEETWNLSSDGGGGTIVDSGTTLSYFAEPGFKIIKKAFSDKVKGYPVVKDFPVLDPCYNVSGIENIELPGFGILFADGAVWNFPSENYYIRLQEDVVCLAILGTPRSALSIIGNYQQQNFHILYDTNKSRLGYAPVSCADM